jgi:Cyclin-dependent kinase regulatory subunit
MNSLAGSCYEYRHVVLPQAIAQHVPSARLLSEPEWRGLGVQQSRGEWLTKAPMANRLGNTLRF